MGNNKHSFKIWKSFFIWFGISLLAALLVLITVLNSPAEIFKGYEEAKPAVITVITIISVIAGTISLYINWIVTSLVLSVSLRLGKNREHNYRTVLFYFLKCSWIYALWIVVIIAGTLISGSSFIMSVPSLILTGVFMTFLYGLMLYKMNKEKKVSKKWIYIIFALCCVAVTVGFMIYTGNYNYSQQIA